MATDCGTWRDSPFGRKWIEVTGSIEKTLFACFPDSAGFAHLVPDEEFDDFLFRAPDCGRDDPATAVSGVFRLLGIGTREDPVGAVALLERAGESASAVPAFLVAECRHQADVSELAPESAFAENEKAFSAGMVLPGVAVAKALFTGMGVERNPEAGRSILLEVAKNRKRNARQFPFPLPSLDYWEGRCLESGWGTPRNPIAARWSYLRSAAWRYGEALVRCGELGFSGKFFSPAETMWFVDEAVRSGLPRGRALRGLCWSSGFGCAGNPEEAVRLLSEAVADGDTLAKRGMADCLRSGNSISSDPAKAAVLYGESAADGDAEAAWKLGDMLLEGIGIDADPARAVELYRFAADQGEIPAFRKLGTCLAAGIGCLAGAREAERWLRKGVTEGDAETEERLGRLLSGDESVRWLESAFRKGRVSAAVPLFERLWEGRGTGPDRARALELFAFAVKSDDTAVLREFARVLLAGGVSGFPETCCHRLLVSIAEHRTFIPFWTAHASIRLALAGNPAATVGLLTAAGGILRAPPCIDFGASERMWLAESCEDPRREPVRDLADCFRFGHGVAKDPPLADRLERHLLPDERMFRPWTRHVSARTGTGAGLRSRTERLRAIAQRRYERYLDLVSGHAPGFLFASPEELRSKAEPMLKGSVAAFRKAADLGDADAMYSLGRIFTGVSPESFLLQEGEPLRMGTVAEGLSWFRQAAERGHGAACFAVGTILRNGRRSDRFAESHAWFERGAELRNPDCQFEVANDMLRGLGCKKDLVLARKGFENAAEGSEFFGKRAEALVRLGDMCWLGWGGVRDFRAAATAYQTAWRLTGQSPQADSAVRIDPGLPPPFRGFLQDSVLHAEAAWRLSKCYWIGRGGERDPDMAVLLAEEAADYLEELPSSKYSHPEEHERRLSVALSAGAFLGSGKAPVPPHSRMKWNELAADGGSVVALKRLAAFSVAGTPKRAAIARAVRFFRRAARLGDADSLFQIGELMSRWSRRAKGTDGSVRSAFPFWKKAAAKGSIPARLRIIESAHKSGKCLSPEETAEMAAWVDEACRAGSGPAFCLKATLAMDGFLFPENPETALDCLLKARIADGPDSGGLASFLLGEFHSGSFGSSANAKCAPHVDPALAFRAYLEAAEVGNIDAQTALAIRYERDFSRLESEADAVRWCRKAAEQGNPSAMGELGRRFWRGEGVRTDRKTAVRWMRKSARNGCPESVYSLALRHLYGECVPRDLDKARTLFARAAELGIRKSDAWLRWLNAERMQRLATSSSSDE